jgi:nicotinamidase-related amidase
MSYARLDPENTVVLFADLQAGIMERGSTNELSRLRRAVSALAKLARLFDIPVVVTTAPAPDGAPRVTPEIAAALGDLPQHVRTTTDAFLDAATRDAILKPGRSALLIDRGHRSALSTFRRRAWAPGPRRDRCMQRALATHGRCSATSVGACRRHNHIDALDRGTIRR